MEGVNSLLFFTNTMLWLRDLRRKLDTWQIQQPMHECTSKKNLIHNWPLTLF